MANIAIVEEDLQQGKKIKSIPAYLFKAFEVDYRPKETEFEKAKKLAVQEKMAEINEQQQQKADEKKAFDVGRKQAVEEYL